MSSPRRVVLVTGSTDGIGKETALGLARTGAHVLVHGRSRPRVDAAVTELARAVPDGSFDGVSFDLGSLDSVRRGAEQIKEKAQRLDVFVANAGIFSNERVVTADGIEITLAVNHVGHFLLFALLEPLIRAAAPARVIAVSSVAHTRGRIHLDDLTLAKGYTGYAAYAQSKLANLLWVRALAERYAPDVLVAYAVHPGVIGTKLLREGFGPVSGGSPAQGARAILALATPEAPPAPSGSYFSETTLAQPGASAQDEEVWRALWTATEKLAKLT